MSADAKERALSRVPWLHTGKSLSARWSWHIAQNKASSAVSTATCRQGLITCHVATPVGVWSSSCARGVCTACSGSQRLARLCA